MRWAGFEPALMEDRRVPTPRFIAALPFSGVQFHPYRISGIEVTDGKRLPFGGMNSRYFHQCVNALRGLTATLSPIMIILFPPGCQRIKSVIKIIVAMTLAFVYVVSGRVPSGAYFHLTEPP